MSNWFGLRGLRVHREPGPLDGGLGVARAAEHRGVRVVVELVRVRGAVRLPALHGGRVDLESTESV